MSDEQQHDIDDDPNGGAIMPSAMAQPEQAAPSMAVAGTGPRIERSIKAVLLPDRYGRAGFRVWLWIDCPSGLMDDAVLGNAPDSPDYSDITRKLELLQTREQAGEDVTVEQEALERETDDRRQAWRDGIAAAQERRLSALRQIVVKHNDWVMWNGTPYPPADSDDFWRAIPDELAAAIIVIMRKEANRLPSGLARAASRR